LVYDILVSGMTTLGDVSVVAPSGAAADAVANGSDASNTVTVTWEPVVDNTPPTVTIDQAVGQADPTGSSPITFDVLFSEPVTGFTGADVSFAGSTAGGTLAAAVSGGPAAYTVSVSGMTSSGTVSASIAAGVAADAAANPSTASTSTDNTVTFDNTPPAVTIDQASGQADPTGSSPITFDVVFSEPVTGFTTGDVSFTGSTAGGTLVAAVSGGPAAYTVSVSGMTTGGDVIASIAAAAAQDAAGNPSTASTSIDNTVTWEPVVDNTPPTVTIDQAVGQADPAFGTSVVFTVTFSEPVTGFGPEDVILGGTAGPTTAVVTGGPSVYTVAVSGMSTKGTVTLAIASGGVLDLSGNPNSGSTTVDGSVTWQGLRPVPSLSIPPTDTVVDDGHGRRAPDTLPLLAVLLLLLSLAALPVGFVGRGRRR
jgi:hypothetical protein